MSAKAKKLPSLVFYYSKKSAAKQVNECEKFFTPLFCTHIAVFYAKNGILWQAEHFFGRANTYEYKAFRADTPARLAPNLRRDAKKYTYPPRRTGGNIQ